MIITITGKPAPQGSKRHIGNGRMIESSKAVGPWREAIRWATAQARAGQPALTGPVIVAVQFAFARPAVHFGKGRNAGQLRADAPRYPMTKTTTGDLDKLTRAVLDGITAGGAILDDKQVVALDARKLYADAPGCRIDIREMTDD
ncbi:MAG TPA: RusA family crossover junction endodeoxyribonuclease [Stellaceae bacterium]|nr:RusA family crossover junction endodeoxyribonuclease [Stellaceae bacterium]